MSQTIDNFAGEYRWLSNFFDVKIKFEGKVYPSTEHAYQAAKTLDPQERDKLSKLGTHKEVKRAGKRVKLRSDWEHIKLQVMETVLREKFKIDWLQKKLLETGDAKLVEGNWWGDTYWGVFRGHGHNHLGRLLMKIRDELKGDTK